MLIHSADVTAVNIIAQLIQLAVAPVFLLAAVGALLNVFTGRLSRIIDKIEKFDHYGEEGPKSFTPAYVKARRDSLAERMRNMNLAIFFCTVTGLLVAVVIVTMFLSAMLEFEKSVLIAGLFILAMFSLVLSLTLFLREIFLTTAFARR